jgi:5-methylthioadenosine/S-adenosylhomocysteine deaminase
MTDHKRICLKNGHVWPGAGAALVEGGLLIKGNQIEAVFGPGEAEAAAASSDEVIDVNGMVLMPPLVDGHVHSNSTLLRGTENSLPLELWSYYAINYGRGSTDEGIRHAALLTDIEMIRGGIGGYIDHFPQTHRSAFAIEAHARSGLRVGFAPFFADMWDEDILEIPLDWNVVRRIAPLAPRRPEDIHAAYLNLHSLLKSEGEGRLTLLAGPNSPQRCSATLWELWKKLQNELDIGSHTHLLETLPQANAAWKRWPDGAVKALDGSGLLHDRLSVAHGIWIDDSERDLLAERGVTVSHNPISNAMLGSGRRRLRDDLDAGLKIALGTDCSNTGGRHDLFEVMRHMLVAGRNPGSDFETWLTPDEVLSAATTHGAGSLNSGNSHGFLKGGTAADVLVLATQRYGLSASAPNLNSLVVHSDPRNVVSLMIDGKWILRDGRIVAFDEAEVLENASRYADDLRLEAVEHAGDIKSLHADYAAWQRGVFSAHQCRHCNKTTPPGTQNFRCDPT